jgi:phosphohistidine phosphatase
MYLYLIRHAIAIVGAASENENCEPTTADTIANDESRPLTKLGRKKMAQVADRLQESGLKFDLIMTSPLVRTRQTADILMDARLSPQLEISADLAPAGNLQSWLDTWASRSTDRPVNTLAVVGHEPNLSEWAELLIFNKIYHQIILKKGGIIGLKFPDDRMTIGTAQLYCSIPPKYLIIRE